MAPGNRGGFRRRMMARYYDRIMAGYEERMGERRRALISGVSGTVLELGPGWVREQGFEVPIETLWNAAEGGGLLSNAIDIPGCSASFVSPEGLLITNHHCIVDILVEHATPEANLVRDGYLAAGEGAAKG